MPGLSATIESDSFPDKPLRSEPSVVADQEALGGIAPDCMPLSTWSRRALKAATAADPLSLETPLGGNDGNLQSGDLIEAGALRKLKHSSRGRMLGRFLEW